MIATPSARSPAAAPLQALRWVVTAVFFAFAIGFGLWSGSIPVLMRQTGTDPSHLGWSLTLHSAAYIAMMGAGGRLTRLVSPRRIMLGTLPLHAAGFWALFSVASPTGLSLALVAVGLTGGLTDLAMNAEGSAVERALHAPVLTRMHAAASAGFAVGALAGSLLATHAGPLACAWLVAAIIAPTILALARSPSPDLAPARVLGPAAGLSALPRDTPSRSTRRTVALFGMVLGACIGAEMCAQMWSASFLEEQASRLAAYAGAGAAFFAGCQALMRWFGDGLRARLGNEPLIRGSLLVAVVGFGLVAASPGFALSLLGFALVGLGTGCVVPVCFALVTQHDPAHAAANLSRAAFIAGAIRLPTPLALGWMTATVSDSATFAMVAVALLLAYALMRAASGPAGHAA